MSNKVENNEAVRSSTDKIYYDQNNIEGQMLRYRTNSLSYKLGMGGILFSLLGAFISLNTMVWNATVTIKIIGNIIILLFGFLSIEKVKSYSRQYSYVLCGIGAICIARIFWCPLQIMIWYGKYLDNPSNPEVEKHLGPVITKPKIQNAYLPDDGYFRGIFAIVLLSIAAAFFIGAGVVGVIKSKKYADYMQTQDTTKGV